MEIYYGNPNRQIHPFSVFLWVGRGPTRASFPRSSLMSQGPQIKFWLREIFQWSKHLDSSSKTPSHNGGNVEAKLVIPLLNS
jgi:hypothetical protein